VATAAACGQHTLEVLNLSWRKAETDIIHIVIE